MKMKEDYLASFNRRIVTNVVYSSGLEPLRVTLCWTDPPGFVDSTSDDRTPDLVNDLDLIVRGPQGDHFPYRLRYEELNSLKRCKMLKMRWIMWSKCIFKPR